VNTIERLWEHAKDLRDDRRALERYRCELIGSHVYAVILSEERRMVALALNAEQQQAGAA
jgi:7-keto-8-aminopelargonate synthetase-like enzyme